MSFLKMYNHVEFKSKVPVLDKGTYERQKY